MKRIGAFFLFLLLAWTIPFAAETAPLTPSIGTRQLLDKIAASRGKVVAINFFASFCPPCRLEIPGLIAARSEFSPDDLEIIGVSFDMDEESMESFIAECKFNYPVYRGNSEVAFAYHVTAIPHNVIYDRKGRIVFNEVGYMPEKQFRAILAGLMEDDRAGAE
jgi:thiol-disulfide isomerase/thioredoxin